MAVLRIETSDAKGPVYERMCRAKGCQKLISMPINGNLCTSCATKARKGAIITLKKGRKKL